MTSASSSTRRTASLTLALCVCAWWPHAISQAKKVCGSGPHTLSQTALDVYLLPNSYVTLHSVPYQQGDIVCWFAVQKTRGSLLSQKLKQNENNFVIGPMDQNLTLLAVKYSYHKKNQASTLATSNTAVLHLASKDVTVEPDQGYTSRQVVQVFTKSLQRIYCFKLIPYTPVKAVVLWKKEAPEASRAVPSNRYYNRDGCLWMNSLQQTDSGNYSLEIENCLSSGHRQAIDFSLSVKTVIYSSTRSTPSHPYTLQTTNYHIQDRSSKVAAATNKISSPVFPSSPPVLRLYLNFSAGTVQLGRTSWNVSLSVNTTLTIQFHTSHSTPERVLVRHNTEIAKRFLVDLNGHTIKIEKIQLPDQGLYRVVAYVGKIRAKARIRIIVQEEFVPSTSTPTTTSSTRIPTSIIVQEEFVSRNSTPTTISSTRIPGSVSGSVIANSSSATNYLNYNDTVPTNSNQSKSSDRMENKDGLQGWVIGIIILCIFLILAIPTVYFSHKHRQSLCFGRCCCRSKSKGGHRDKSNYWNSAYTKVVIPSASSNHEKDEINTSSLPDVVAGAPKQQAREVVTTNHYDAILATSHDHDKEKHQTQETVLYASVNKKKKGNCDPSSSENSKKTTSEQSSDATKNQPISTEQTALGAEADEKVLHPNKPQATVKDASGKEGNGTEKRVKTPTRKPPPRPAPYHTSKEKLFEKEEGPVSSDTKTPSKIGTDDRSQATVYAEISTPVQTKDPDKQSGQDSEPSTKKHTIQYVEY